MTAIDINKLFREKGRTLGAVESFTGGLFANDITSVPGASHFFKGSLVTYATEEKARILGISYELIDKKGVVSQECAAEMASHGKSLMNVDYCISFTGNAGPSPMEDKPVGQIYIGVAMYDTVRVYSYKLEGDRKNVQKEAIKIAYDLLINLLKEFN